MAEKNPELQWLKGKVVIIAPEHVGIQDFHLAPYAREFWKTEGRMMSGAELHANIVETLLSGRFPKSVPSWIRILNMVILLLVGTLLFFRLHPLRGLVVGLLLSLFCVAIAYLLFRIHWIYPVSGVQLGLALSYLGTLGFRLTGEERERVLLRQMFGQYVSDYSYADYRYKLYEINHSYTSNSKFVLVLLILRNNIA
jgi:adenylate cyclase